MNLLISWERGFSGDRDVITWEADHRNVELLSDQEELAAGSKTVVSLGVKELTSMLDGPELEISERALFKCVYLRASFLAAEVLKQLSDNNVADLGTKMLDGKRIQRLMTLAGLSPRNGRHALAYRAAGEA